jgi:hypothetical protein
MNVGALSRWICATALLLIWCCATGAARAQCGGPTSTCRDCHEARGVGAFVVAEPWHRDHELGDFCSNCHGGSPTVADEAAHAGLVDPLLNHGERCLTCHADKPRIAAVYQVVPKPPLATATGITPLARAAQPAPRPRARRGPGNAVVAAAIVVIALLWLLGALRHERGPGVFRGIFRRAEWSAYTAGALLGVVVSVSMALLGRRLSGSGAYQELAGPLGRALQPSSVYWTQVIRPGEHWNSLVLAGAILGAFSAASLGKRFRLRWMPDSQWASAFGPSVRTRWSLAFIGALLTGIGAGVAGGCTASLAVSGGAALAPGAFAFMAGMFAAGIPTARLIYRRSSQ